MKPIEFFRRLQCILDNDQVREKKKTIINRNKKNKHTKAFQKRAKIRNHLNINVIDNFIMSLRGAALMMVGKCREKGTLLRAKTQSARTHSLIRIFSVLVMVSSGTIK